jgi:hypothetical protein
METEALTEAIEKQLTATEPPQAKANEIQTTTTAEVIIIQIELSDYIHLFFVENDHY